MITNKNQSKKLTYPILKLGNGTPKRVYLFLNKYQYIIIESEDEEYPIGCQGKNGDATGLEDYNEPVTICNA